jgi:hypothetical protein
LAADDGLPFTAMIEVDDLACKFGDFEAVKDISFRAARGETPSCLAA